MPLATESGQPYRNAEVNVVTLTQSSVSPSRKRPLLCVEEGALQQWHNTLPETHFPAICAI